jgi:nitronate monooxygenase
LKANFCELPIWQAPTGSIAGPELCAAVSESGGMGAMGLTWTAAAHAREHVRQVRSITHNPFHVNFVLHFEPVALTAVLEEGAALVSFSWGDPADHVALVRSFGAKFGVQVVNLDGAKRALQLGADFLVVQGVEAGGHVQSSTPLEVLLPSIVESALGNPVIAAGGLVDGSDVGRVLAVGATAAMLGTRFVASQESRAHETYKKLLVELGETALTLCFDGGWPGALHRVLRNPTLERWEAAGCCPRGTRPNEGDVIGTALDGSPILSYDDVAPRIGMTGNVEKMCLYAGAGVGRIRDIPAAGELTQRIWAECQAANATPAVP